MRPHELRGIGAPQAINQGRMFENYVHYQFDFPIADGHYPEAMTQTIQFQLQKQVSIYMVLIVALYILTCHSESL